MSLLAKKAELDLLRSTFNEEELSFLNPLAIAELDLLEQTEQQCEDFDIDMTLNIHNKNPFAIVCLTITLPVGYPSTDTMPRIFLRLKQSGSDINEKSLASNFNSWLQSECQSGDPVISAAVDWIHDALSSSDYSRPVPTDAPTQGEEDLTSTNNMVCLWIVSHHIRNPKKRKVIVEWARELNLQGCCLPGKPGIIVAEGEDSKADEYWRRVRVLTWKRIQLKDREIIGSKLRFTDGFHEIGGTLSNKISYMTMHGVTRERTSVLFGFKVD